MPTSPSRDSKSLGDSVGSYKGYSVNTRGIPYDVDPRRFYEYRAYQQKKLADNWLEKLVYDIFGPSFIGSLALAIDPYARFKMSSIQVSPVNRTRLRTAIPSIPRWSRAIVHSKGGSNGVTCLNKNEAVGYAYADSDVLGNLTSTQVIPSKSFDTTYRTRGHTSDYGEFEYFKPAIHDAGCRLSWKSNDAFIGASVVCGSTVYRSVAFTITNKVGQLSSNGRYSSANFNTLYNNERSFCDQLMAAKGMGMVLRALPLTRSFSLYREIAELKDLPLTLRTTYEQILRATSLSKLFKASWRDLRVSDIPRITHAIRREAKRVGNDYLNTQFGWGPLIRDLQSLIDLPTRIGLKVNNLIRRNGRLSRWRSRSDYVFPIDSPPGFTLDIPPGFSLPPATQTLGSRKVELRCVVYAKVTFPDINVPYLKSKLLDEIWGVDPRLSDLYDLIPWTWLINWFSDLGDYVHLMDTINDDRTLINGGFLTYVSSGLVTSSRTVDATATWSRKWLGVYDTGTVTTHPSFVQSASASFSYERRKDLATISDVRCTNDPSSLNSDQLAILGALTSKFL